MNRLRVLGVDPGTKITGYGIVDISGNRFIHIDNGLIIPPAKNKLNYKLHHIHQQLTNLIDQFKPVAMAVEQVFLSRNFKSVLHLGHVKGMALLAAAEFDLTLSEYSPKTVKKAVTGYGNASKEQIQYMVANILKLPENAYEDASDALALSICHLSNCRAEAASGYLN